MLGVAIAATILAVPAVLAWALTPYLTTQALTCRAIGVWKTACFGKTLLPYSAALIAVQWLLIVAVRWHTTFVQVVILTVFAAIVGAYLYDALRGAGDAYWKAVHHALQSATSEMTPAQRAMFFGNRTRLVQFDAAGRTQTLERILRAS